MKPQGEYEDLIAEYQNRQALLEIALRMNRILLSSINSRFFRPIDAKIVRVNYLGWGRNAWHSTWINQYHPGTIDCDLGKLKKRAEGMRRQGSQLWIETRDALWLKFQCSNLMIVEINSAPKNVYDRLLNYNRKNGLRDFWTQSDLGRDNWLLFFELGDWRPDLVSKKDTTRLDASPIGGEKTLRWSPRISEINKDFFDFAEGLILSCFDENQLNGVEEND